MKEKLEDKRWREFADWVQAAVELESQEVVQSLGNSTLEWRQGRRDAFEDVWAMVLVFNEDREKTKCPLCRGEGTNVHFVERANVAVNVRCARCGGRGYLEGEELGRKRSSSEAE